MTPDERIPDGRMKQTAAIVATPDLIDARCDCAECATEQRTYDVPGGCSNCGHRFVVRNRFGDRPPLYVECPNCGVSDYSWRETHD